MNLDYIAGFFDGEGSLTYNRAGKQWLVKIAQSERAVLDEIVEFLQSLDVHCSVHKKPFGEKCTRIPYDIVIHRKRDVCKFLGLMHHRLVVKKQLAEDYYRFIKLFPTMSRQQRYACREDRKYACKSARG
jgi:intein-encoded DNA endonuclease-like protein